MTARGPYAKSRERKNAIADTALKMVVEMGHESLSIAQIANGAGISESSLQYHFPTRDEIFVAALTAADERERREYSKVGLLADIDFLRMVARRGVSEPNRIRLFTEMLANASDASHPAHEYIREHHRYAMENNANLLRERQRTGAAHPDLDPDEFARQLVAVWDGLQAQWLVSRDFDLEESIVEACRRLSGEDVMNLRRSLSQLVEKL